PALQSNQASIQTSSACARKSTCSSPSATPGSPAPVNRRSSSWPEESPALEHHRQQSVENTMSTRKTTLFYTVLLVISSIAVGMVIASQWGLPQASSAQTVNVPPMNSAPLSGAIDAATFRNIAKAQVPTVVNIQTSAHIRQRESS